MSPVRLAAALLLSLTLGSFAPTSRAQLPPVDSTTATPIPGAGHDYLGGLSETVNPASGSIPTAPTKLRLGFDSVALTPGNPRKSSFKWSILFQGCSKTFVVAPMVFGLY